MLCPNVAYRLSRKHYQSTAGCNIRAGRIFMSIICVLFFLPAHGSLLMVNSPSHRILSSRTKHYYYRLGRKHLLVTSFLFFFYLTNDTCQIMRRLPKTDLESGTPLIIICVFTFFGIPFGRLLDLGFLVVLGSL